MKTLISTSAVGAATTFGQRARAVAFSLLATGLLAVPATAYSAIIDFEGVGDGSEVGDFYNGDFLAFDVGVGFTGAAWSYEEVASGGSGLFVPDPEGGITAMLVTDPSAEPGDSVVATLNFASGFTSVSFLYAAIIQGSVQFFDGIDGSGNQLTANNILAVGPQVNCGSGILACDWTQYSQSFAGVARSMVFSGANAFVIVDNIDLAPVPLPAAAWLLLSGLAGLGALRRRRAVAA